MATLYEMFITHRGYERIEQVVDPSHVFLVKDSRKDEPPVLIFLLGSEKLNIDGVKEMILVMETFQTKHGVMVYQNSVTSSARKALELLYQYRIELFAVHELQYDLTKHMYFCPHEKVSHSSELGHLQTQLPKLPKILHSDPVVRFFGFKKNDILRIRRPNNTIAYRVVR